MKRREKLVMVKRKPKLEFWRCGWKIEDSPYFRLQLASGGRSGWKTIPLFFGWRGKIRVASTGNGSHIDVKYDFTTK
jgi:hypothetical protein